MLTGATGFVGRHCLAKLERGHDEIHAVSSRPAPKNPGNVHWHQANLLDETQASDLMRTVKPTHLLNLAWNVKPKEFWTSPENFHWVRAALQLSQCFLVNGGQRLVTAGTCAEYDWAYGYCSEGTTPLFPNTIYGTCKHAFHLLLDAFARQSDLSAAWGRLFFLYGPSEQPDKLIASVIRSVINGEVARCTHGNQIRDFIFVEDAAEAFLALLDSTVTGPVNVASGIPVTIKDVVSKIAVKQGRAELIQFGAIMSPENEPRLLVADITRLQNEVGWRPKYNLDQGLDETIRWWTTQFEKRD